MAVIYIVVGALGYVAYSAFVQNGVGVNSIESTLARIQVTSDYSTLGTATQTFKRATQECTASTTSASGDLQCLEQADTAWSQAIQSYATSLSQVSFPASAQADADAAHAAALAAVSAVNALAASPDVQSYSTASTSPAFQAALHNVDSTYNRLLDTLANG